VNTFLFVIQVNKLSVLKYQPVQVSVLKITFNFVFLSTVCFIYTVFNN